MTNSHIDLFQVHMEDNGLTHFLLPLVPFKETVSARNYIAGSTFPRCPHFLRFFVVTPFTILSPFCGLVGDIIICSPDLHWQVISWGCWQGSISRRLKRITREFIHQCLSEKSLGECRCTQSLALFVVKQEGIHNI